MKPVTPVFTDIAKPIVWILSASMLVAGVSRAGETGEKTPGPESGHAAAQDAASYEQLLSEAEALIRRGKPADAYRLLERLEFEHAGEVRFDYLLGIAALDSGKPDKATFAFERVLAVNPDFAAARLDMARAYYQLGDMQRAKTEFSAVLKQNPSEAAQANIQKYLDAIETRQEGKRVRMAAYIEGSVGRDTNVNYSTSQQQVFVDRFATLATINASNIQAADKYYAVAAGGDIEYGLNANWRLYAGLDARKRNNNTQAQFDALSLDTHAGLSFETKADQAHVEMSGGRYDLGGSRNSDTAGFKGEWRHVLGPANQVNVFAQQVQYRFADPVMQPNDFDQYAVGLGWLHVLHNGKTNLSASVHYGTEKDVSPIITVASAGGGRNDGAKRFGGLRVGAQTVFGETTLFASAGMQNGDYNKINYYFQRQRNDRLRDVAIGAAWKWTRLWTLRPQLSYSRNDSNISIYDYKRMDVSLTVRRDFR